MIYEPVAPKVALTQGDVLDDCPIIFWEVSPGTKNVEAITLRVRVVVLTQACDLANAKTDQVIVAMVHNTRSLVERGVLKPQIIREQIRLHRVYGWYFLPSGPGMEESIVDLRDLHTLPRLLLQQLIDDGKRVTRITTPYREHLAQHFSITYSRIALPEPYPTD